MRPVRKADNLTTILCHCHEILAPSWNPLGHSRPVTGLLYLYMEEMLGDMAIFVVKGQCSGLLW